MRRPAMDARSCARPTPSATVPLVDADTGRALREMVELADNLPGQFKPEFELGYWAGVAEGTERWWVRFEGDIRDNEFTVLGHSAAEALLKAAREASDRVP
jgi:hypothetical protein